MKFCDKVYSLCKQVPVGKVTTYGEIARKLGTSAQAVGQALKKNPYAPVVPCHRVVKSDGSVGGFFGQTTGENVKRKIKLLEEDGLRLEQDKIAEFENKKFTFSSY